jgi:uncharacterized cysteine cluster protein YcgN (CxxCxxCC family)
MKPEDLPDAAWEALCRRCGKCCTEKVDIDGAIYLTRFVCRFLDKVTKQCLVYEDRFEAEPSCSDVKSGIPLGLFPMDCPYVQSIENYKAPIESWDDPAIDEAIEEIFKDVDGLT